MQNFKIWAKAAGVRALKTAAQTALATIGTTTAVFADINWTLVGSTALVAAILSVLTSIAGLPEVKQQGEIAAVMQQLEDTEDPEV